MRALLRLFVLPAVAATLLLTGCGTQSEAAAPQSPRTEQPSAVPSEPGTPAGRILTAAQARDVIPPLALFPAGWRVDPSGGLPSPADSSATISPARCQALFDQLHRQQRDAGDAVAASAERNFRSRDGNRFVAVAVNSYTDAAAEDLFRTAAEALADCPQFRSTGAVPAEFRASPLSFPRLGEERLALRFIGAVGPRPFTLDFVAVRVGRNTVTAQVVSFGKDADPVLLERVANTAVRQLPQE
ncbi:MAG TPA: hypothetical protein VGP02_17825 [Mycobacteriales bacterium]|jgi:hypothetical protein|nr:hypothetical protein [Mycobacteriales bacterium]